MGRDRGEIVSQIRHRLDVEENTSADSRLLAALDELLQENTHAATPSPVSDPAGLR